MRWIDAINCRVPDIMVTCNKGAYILKAIGYSMKEKCRVPSDQLCDAIQEVGTLHVVQVVIDAAPICKVSNFLVKKLKENILSTVSCGFDE